MIKIKKTKYADTRSCDYTNVTDFKVKKDALQHIEDVKQGLDFFKGMLDEASKKHDFDKIKYFDEFYSNFKTGFKEHTWLDNHYKLNRHHLNRPEGIPEDVNLIDVIEMITDCIMAGKARAGEVYNINLNEDVLEKAFKNTITLLDTLVVVKE